MIFIYRGRSMAPLFKTGDILICRSIKNMHKIKIGSVIIFQDTHTKSHVCHRIIKIRNHNSFITKGDRNPNIDPYVTLHDHTDALVYKIIRGKKKIHLNAVYAAIGLLISYFTLFRYHLTHRFRKHD